MLDKMKKLFELQKAAKQMQDKLTSMEIQAEACGGKVKMCFNGKMEIKDITIDDSFLTPAKKGELQQGIKRCYQEALVKSQRIAQEALKGISGLDLPGF